MSRPEEAADVIPEIVFYLKERMAANNVQIPDLGIICGSGLGSLAATITNSYTIKYEEIKHFPQSTVAGHAGELVFGKLGGKNVVAMKGRIHFYEGYTPQQVGLPVRVMAALGIKALIVTNAAGGANPHFNVGDVMVIKDQICTPGLAGHHPLVGRNDERFGPRFPAVNGVFDKEMADAVFTCSKRIGSRLKLQRGVYFGVSGPSYETPHEIGVIRALRGDAVGMSTVFEILVAAHCGLRLLGLSLITNRCVGPDDDSKPPSHEEVLAAVKKGEKEIQALVSEFVQFVDLSKTPRTKAFEFFSRPPQDTSPLRSLKARAPEGSDALIVVAGLASIVLIGAAFVLRARNSKS